MLAVIFPLNLLLIIYILSPHSIFHIMIKKNVLTGLLLLFSGWFSLFAQNKYWVFFKDKPTAFSVPALSLDALESRLWQNIPLDEKDYPVSETYLNDLTQSNIRVQYPSRWLNAVSVEMTDIQAEEIAKRPYVKQIRKIMPLLSASHHQINDSTLDSVMVNRYDWQLKMLGLDLLHEAGYTGKGVKMAIFDNGFKWVDQLSGFTHVFQDNRINYTYDYVDHDQNVFEECASGGYCKHGSWVFSIIAGIVPGQLEGSAPGADYYLFRTENDASETHQEEDNWVRAAEVADSLGAQVFSTSLGYFLLDTTDVSYQPSDMDGDKAIITQAADIAASKGIIVVNSAGNEGSTNWRTIIAPADGDSVIAVGAVNPYLIRANFSSQGNSADGRIKPDIMALGQAIYIQDLTGTVVRGNGTSFSCPVLSGMMTCLRQARPNIPAYDLYKAMIASADRFLKPDSLYGYGIPNAGKVLLQTASLTSDLEIAPNPNDGSFHTIIQNNGSTYSSEIQVFDAQGKKISNEIQIIYSGKQVTGMNLNLQPGIYFMRLWNSDKKQAEGVKQWIVK